MRESEEAKKVEKAASAAEKFCSELDVLKQRAREIPRTLTDDEIRACEAVKLQMKGKLPEPGKVSVAEVEKIDEAVRAANASGKAESAAKAKIIGRSGIDIFDEVKRIDKIEVEFRYSPKYNKAEFTRQLADQQKGMNRLTVQEYLDNRQRYIVQGRTMESNAVQQAARENAYLDKVAELRRSGLSAEDAKIQACEWMKSQAALHNPDQVAGGSYGNIGGVGSSGVNSSIGAQWRYRIDSVDEQIKRMAKNMTEIERKSTYLNVILTYKGE